MDEVDHLVEIEIRMYHMIIFLYSSTLISCNYNTDCQTKSVSYSCMFGAFAGELSESF